MSQRKKTGPRARFRLGSATSEELPSPRQRLLLNPGLRPITHARRKDTLQPRELRRRHARIIDRIDRTKLTFDDVTRNARSGDLARRRRRRIEQLALQARIARLFFGDERRRRRARIAALDQIRRLVANDFLVLRNVGVVGLNVRDPLIHLFDGELQQRALRAVQAVELHILDQHYLIVRVAVGFLQALAHRERVVAQMDVAGGIVVRVTAIIDDRHIA